MIQFELHQGDCLEVMRELPDNSVDSIVTDPPYELGFMGKSWDASGIAYNVDMWREALRVLKPGGHLLAFSGSRTYHRMACAIEDAGFEIRDQIQWIYGSGFPKSLDVSKAIDKTRDDRDDILRVTSFMADAAERAGITRADVDAHMGTSDMGGWWLSRLRHRCQCPKWEQWQQLKTLLSLGDEMDAEVWRLNGRKGTPGEAWSERDFFDTPTGGLHGGSGNTVGSFTGRQAKPGGVTDAARQWEGWGTALKPAHEPICVARKPLAGTVAANVLEFGTGALNIDACRVEHVTVGDGNLALNPHLRTHINGGNGGNIIAHEAERRVVTPNATGRWPANLIHDGSDEVVGLFPESSVTGKRSTKSKAADVEGTTWLASNHESTEYTDSGSAARFFYCAKASKSDRGEGNNHPTVKPTQLMRYLVRLVTPPGGLVLDPFMGSGSTGKAAMLEGVRFVGIDLTAEYIDIARDRIENELIGDLV